MNIFFRIYEYSQSFIPTFIAFILLNIYLKNKWNRFFLYKIIIFTLYINMALSVAGAGTFYDIGQYDEIIRTNEISINIFASKGIMTYLLNVIMFMPLGFLIPFIWQSKRFIDIVYSGFLFTVLIELSQLLNRRNTAVDDLLMNIVGTIIGYFLFILIRKMYLIKASMKNGFCNSMLTIKRNEIKYEDIIYLVCMFLGRFFLYDWRHLVKLFRYFSWM